MTSRHDPRSVSRFTPQAIALSPPQSDREAAFQGFDTQTMFLALALEALAASLERQQAAAALRKNRSTKFISPAYLKARARAEMDQAGAVVHNATQSADLADALVRLRPAVNDAWRQLLAEVARHGRPTLTAAEVSNKFAAHWRASMLWFQEGFNLDPFQMKDVMAQVDRMIAEQQFAPVLPETLLDEAWQARLIELSVQLRALSVSFANLQAALQAT
jgi:hypothetical protein